MILPSLISGIVMTFAHTLGEFGLVLMVGGSIPGVSKVISISIFEKVELLQYNDAHGYAIILLIFSAVFIFLVKLTKEMSNKRRMNI